jgi:hypothetical protein
MDLSVRFSSLDALPCNTLGWIYPGVKIPGPMNLHRSALFLISHLIFSFSMDSSSVAGYAAHGLELRYSHETHQT